MATNNTNHPYGINYDLLKNSLEEEFVNRPNGPLFRKRKFKHFFDRRFFLYTEESILKAYNTNKELLRTFLTQDIKKEFIPVIVKNLGLKLKHPRERKSGVNFNNVVEVAYNVDPQTAYNSPNNRPRNFDINSLNIGYEPFSNNKNTKNSTTGTRSKNPTVNAYRKAILAKENTRHHGRVAQHLKNKKYWIQGVKNSQGLTSIEENNTENIPEGERFSYPGGNDSNGENGENGIDAFSFFGGAAKTFGSRAQVWHGSAIKTTGGLFKSDLMMNKRGRIISKKRHKLGKKAHKKLVAAGYKTKKGVFGVFKNGKNLSS